MDFKQQPENFVCEEVILLQKKHFDMIQKSIREIEKIFSDKKYIKETLASKNIKESPTRGVFVSYDFHISTNGPKLIEINTNAGGVFLANKILKADELFEQAVMQMFFKEYNLGRQTSEKPRTIAIVDENPNKQYLYPEFLLFQETFKKYGIDTFITDPKNLIVKNDKLFLHDIEIDLIYNRLTDFYFEKPENKQLLEAFQKNLCVITPSPTHYCLYADKLNLIKLGTYNKSEILNNTLLKIIIVDEQEKVKLQKDKKLFFFKPLKGYGGKGAYCGKKMTTKIWDSIDSSYLAQECVRAPEISSASQKMRYDLRVVTYDGAIQQILARVYSGQVTNFKTKGGGYAKVQIES